LVGASTEGGWRPNREVRHGVKLEKAGRNSKKRDSANWWEKLQGEKKKTQEQQKVAQEKLGVRTNLGGRESDWRGKKH